MSKPQLGVTFGLRGYFAVLYDDEGPIQTGFGSYGNYEGAHKEAVEWARAEELPEPEYRPFKEEIKS